MHDYASRRLLLSHVFLTTVEGSLKRLCKQGHVSYFDRDGDGVIWPSDTWRGFHDIGFNWFLSIIAVFVIHGTFSYWTQESW